MSDWVADLTHEFRRHKRLADGALAGLPDEAFFRRPGEASNPPALVVKHLAGNLRSRWTDFLTTDGDDPTRDRDAEFRVGDGDSRENLTAAWEAGWAALFATLETLTPDDWGKVVTIRGEPHTVRQAVVRGLTHAAYHVGQLLYLCRLLNPAGGWQTIAPGASREHRPGYLKAVTPESP